MSTFSINHSIFKNFSLKDFSSFLVYLGIALLAISDSGIQLLILMEIGPGSRTLPIFQKRVFYFNSHCSSCIV